jgi:hypothetical protein
MALSMVGSGDPITATCWSHGRRKFFELADVTGGMKTLR